MIVGDSVAMTNRIIEGVSDQLRAVVQAIAAEPADPIHRADWLVRYPAIEDLNILTATRTQADHLEVTPEYPDRFPYVVFFIDEQRSNPEKMEEHFVASLGCSIGVKGTTFAICQKEIHEIHHCIRSIMLLDKSFGEFSGVGGIVDVLKWSHFAEPEFEIDDMRQFTLGIDFYYHVWFKERVYR